jgi:hypothetical protein
MEHIKENEHNYIYFEKEEKKYQKMMKKLLKIWEIRLKIEEKMMIICQNARIIQSISIKQSPYTAN